MMIPLKQWAKEHDTPYRTALSWAKKLGAKRATYSIEVTTTKRVRGLVVEADTMVPEPV